MIAAVAAVAAGATRDRKRFGCAAALIALLALVGCGPAPRTPDEVRRDAEWRDFQGTWTAVGTRHRIDLGTDRRASIASFEGSVVLFGASRPAVGFRAEAIVLNDSATGMIGRAVWTDDRGDQAYSEIKGEGTSTGNRIVGAFVGGTGRYRGVTGTYEFEWRFVLESEDGTLQGQSTGLKGRVQLASPSGVPAAAGTRQ